MRVVKGGVRVAALDFLVVSEQLVVDYAIQRPIFQ